MNTVDSLNKFGKALLGNDYVPDAGKTDADAILDIAKGVKAKGGVGSGVPIYDLEYNPESEITYSGTIRAGLTPGDFVPSMIRLGAGTDAEFVLQVLSSASLDAFLDNIGVVVASVTSTSASATNLVLLEYNPETGYIGGPTK